MTVRYDYPTSGQYNETTATLDDGRVMRVNTQYSSVMPQGQHVAGCSQLTMMGGVCDCGLLDGVDTVALVADARVNGLKGLRPSPSKPSDPAVVADLQESADWRSERGLTLSEEMDRADTRY